MGYCDRVDPAKMEIESSSFTLSAILNADSTPHVISSGAREREESAAGAARYENEDWPSTSAGVKRAHREVRSKESRRRKQGKGDETNSTDDVSAFKEMWEKSLQENKRFEKSMKMFQENQNMQTEQTMSLLSRFKDLRASLREDQAEVIHAISPFSMKLCQVEGTTQ